MNQYAAQVAQGHRFKFGANWARFLKILDAKKVAEARQSLQCMLGTDNLANKTFLDIGSGSGLFSLAAKLLEARVHSFDYDPQSTACTAELKRRYFANDANWVVEEASVLDEEYLASLGRFDIVYSWGVLHHTGEMWKALENAAHLVNPGGTLFIAIYNQQGWISIYWREVKRLFNHDPALRLMILLIHTPYLYMARLALRTFTGRLNLERGMSFWYDMKDWLGGYPFEVAKPEEIIDFFYNKGFELKKLRTCGGRHGCNEFVFQSKA